MLVKILDQLLVAWLGDKPFLSTPNLGRIFLTATSHSLEQNIVLSSLTALGFYRFVLTAGTLTIFRATVPNDVLLTVDQFLFSQLKGHLKPLSLRIQKFLGQCHAMGTIILALFVAFHLPFWLMEGYDR